MFPAHAIDFPHVYMLNVFREAHPITQGLGEKIFTGIKILLISAKILISLQSEADNFWKAQKPDAFFKKIVPI